MGRSCRELGEALGVSLDIAKAFDHRVWHRALLSKLPKYGIPERLCKWVSRFLSGRSIQVVIDGCCSDTKIINTGVPQGSVLSSAYKINDILNIPGILCYAVTCTLLYWPYKRPSFVHFPPKYILLLLIWSFKEHLCPPPIVLGSLASTYLV